MELTSEAVAWRRAQGGLLTTVAHFITGANADDLAIDLEAIRELARDGGGVPRMAFGVSPLRTVLVMRGDGGVFRRAQGRVKVWYAWDGFKWTQTDEGTIQRIVDGSEG